MREIWARGRQPLLVGGTMLYFHALTAGIAELPAGGRAQSAAQIDAQAAAGGWAALHEELARVDPAAAARIHVNDPQRIQRALEVYRVTGEPDHPAATATACRLCSRAWRCMEFALAPRERARLAPPNRRALRGDDGLPAFWMRCETLYERSDLTAEHPSMRAVGYRQAWTYLAGQCGLDEAKEQAIAATRQLAKRQLTWLRRRKRATWFDSMQPDVASMIMDALSEGGFAGWSAV